MKTKLSIMLTAMALTLPSFVLHGQGFGQDPTEFAPKPVTEPQEEVRQSDDETTTELRSMLRELENRPVDTGNREEMLKRVRALIARKKKQIPKRSSPSIPKAIAKVTTKRDGRIDQPPKANPVLSTVPSNSSSDLGTHTTLKPVVRTELPMVQPKVSPQLVPKTATSIEAALSPLRVEITQLTERVKQLESKLELANRKLQWLNDNKRNIETVSNK